MKQLSHQPRVSCLCVTRHRPNELRKAIVTFMHQTYANKDLVVVYEDDDLATASVVDEFRNHRDISARAVPVVPKATLGELRNLAIDACKGEYICQWDDDDWYHVDRIQTQLMTLQGMRQDACVLTNWYIFDASEGCAYLSHFRLWEGSLMCRKAALGDHVRYPSLSKMEDSFFMNILIARCRVVPLVAPQLYLYVLHAKNTWDAYHRQVLLSSSQRLSDGTARLFSDTLSGRWSPEEASQRLSAADLLGELNYLHVNTLTPTDAQLQRYGQMLERAAHTSADAVATMG